MNPEKKARRSARQTLQASYVEMFRTVKNFSKRKAVFFARVLTDRVIAQGNKGLVVSNA